MKYFISVLVAVATFCALLTLFLTDGVEPSITLSSILALFSWVIGYVVFLKFCSIERKLDEEDKKKYNVDNREALRSFRKNKDNHNESI